MRCPNCGNENPPDYMFCDECGARLMGGEQAADTSDTDSGGSTAAPSGSSPDMMNMQSASSDQSNGGADSESSPVMAAGAASTDTGDASAGGYPAPDSAPPPVTEDTAAAAPPPYNYDQMGSDMSASDQNAAAPAAEMPDITQEATTSAPSAEAESADTFEAVPVEAAAPAAMPADMGSADAGTAAATPATPAAAAGTSNSEWATEALKHLDTAQQAMASGDWGGFGQAMSTLRAALEGVVAGAVVGSAAAPSAPPMATAGTAEDGASSAAWGGSAITDNGASAPGYQGQGYEPYPDSTPTGVAAASYAAPVEQAAQPGPAPSPVPMAVPAAAAAVTGMADMGEQGIARLVVISTGAEMSLPEQEEITVGREDPSSGIFPDLDLTPYGGEDGGVSRRHARLLHIGDDYFVEDLQSTNYTKLDGQRLPAHVRERLEDGARLDFGRVAVIFRRS